MCIPCPLFRPMMSLYVIMLRLLDIFGVRTPFSSTADEMSNNINMLISGFI